MNFANYRTMPLILTVGVLWTVGAWVLSSFREYRLVQGVGAPVIVLILLYLYDRWLWKRWSRRFPVLNVLVNVPNLNGKYQGTVEYTDDGMSRTEPCEIRIRQRASRTRIRCKVSKDEGQPVVSESKDVLFIRDNLGYALLFYHRPPDKDRGNASGCRDGFSRLDVHPDQGNIRLEGYYFTNEARPVRGHMIVTRQGDR